MEKTQSLGVQLDWNQGVAHDDKDPQTFFRPIKIKKLNNFHGSL